MTAQGRRSWSRARGRPRCLYCSKGWKITPGTSWKVVECEGTRSRPIASRNAHGQPVRPTQFASAKPLRCARLFLVVNATADQPHFIVELYPAEARALKEGRVKLEEALQELIRDLLPVDPFVLERIRGLADAT